MGQNTTLTCLDRTHGIWQIYQRLSTPVNAYLVAQDDGLLLIDTGNSGRPGQVLGAIRRVEGETGSRLAAILLTHGHPDHAGGLVEVADTAAVPIYAHGAEIPFITGAAAYGEIPGHWGYWLPKQKAVDGPAPGTVRTLADGDRFGPLLACHTPGHTPGHLAYWHEAAGIWFAGDLVMRLAPWLHGPLWPATYDIALARRSARRLLEAGPIRMLCMGHGGPITDQSMEMLQAYLRRSGSS